ncbi:MAG TPA: P-loop NTPase fold protein [Pyrinomonadaceae bacterium]|nr:P-loop NTPase fold protein [Pyrinomonadaceae bacterium]
MSDSAPLHLDDPAHVDYLGRRDFAVALAVRLKRVWEQVSEVRSRRGQNRGEPSRSSFVLHLHGAWGAGKTSLLNFLRAELQSEGGAGPGATSDAEGAGWVVVDFNAWQHQRVSPPWWPLHETIYRQSVQQLERKFGARPWAWFVRLREHWWRFSTGRKAYLWTALICFFFLAVLLYMGALTGSAAGDNIKTAAAVAGAVGGIWSLGLVVSRSLLSGTSRSAQTFMEGAGDPMERVSGHFRDLLGWVGRPVVVFVDDLDRCQPKYVVELLEGVQTLFSDPRIFYVIAADRRWLHVCFEKSYSDFSDAVREPGRRLGSLFLEKAFELSVSVPRVSPEVRERYWRHLVTGAGSKLGKEMEEARAEAAADFEEARTESEVFELLREPASVGADPLREHVRMGAAVRRLASHEMDASAEQFLQRFAPLLEPNPRAMKRLVNAYTVLRDAALLAGVDVLGDLDVRKQLALWAIVSLRWPMLEEYLEQHPEEIDLIREGRYAESGGEALKHLMASPEVGAVFRGDHVGVGLRSETVRSIIGVGAAEPPGAPVT